MSQYSIIIVNYKTPHLVIDCIRSAVTDIRTHEIEVIVVDNDSGDYSEEKIMEAFPFVRFVQMGYNSGFARANNRGIQESKGQIILLLNSDTLDQDGGIIQCFRRFDRESDVVACGLQLLNPDGSPQISGNYVMKGGLNYLMALPYVGRLLRGLALAAGARKPNIPEARDTVTVDWINGAFLMVKKSAIARAGLLDEDFFLYSEEAEWCSRLKKQGRLLIYGDLHVIHLEGGSSNAAYESRSRGYQVLSDKKGYQILVSNFVRFRKEFGPFWYLLHLGMHTFTILIALLILIFTTLFPGEGVRRKWQLWQGYTRNVLGSYQFLIPILFNRKHFYKVL
ncbi:hypothetical protein GCM10027051_14190 [Niabella terrae]